MQKYTVTQYSIHNILNWIDEKQIAIPEIQRPFVWDTTKVRDLLDSLYKGFPIGYIIAWKNPDIRLKDGTLSGGKKVLIDGQQRITALRASISGELIVDKNYKKDRITIAFNPITEEFATLTPAIEKDKVWIKDISGLMKSSSGLFGFVKSYCELNKDIDPSIVESNISKLLHIKEKHIGCIELEANLDIETVTEIFIRINSKGVVLSQADFAMSKIASYDDRKNFGVNLRKAIDYFCHLAKEPHFFDDIKTNDLEFQNTEYFNKIAWLKSENDELYDLDYSDVLRVAFTKEFERGKMSDLVGLLAGRDFENRTNEEKIVEDTFDRLSKAVLSFVNETHFKDFVMTIKSLGFIDSSLISSKNALNFAYIVYLKLREQGMDRDKIKKLVSKWFLMSILTQRYSSSPESQFDFDIKQIASIGVEKFLAEIEEAKFSENFWSVALVQDLEKSSINNLFFNVFIASQIKSNDKGFLSSNITVSSLVAHRGDIHHIFPKEYLKENGYDKKDYNQIANFVYTQSEINIKIGKKSPNEYASAIDNQVNGGELEYGSIGDKEELESNFEENCVPLNLKDYSHLNYADFLLERRKLMANKIRGYYLSI